MIPVSFVRKLGRRGVITVPVEVLEATHADIGDIVELRVVRLIKQKGAA